MKLGVIVLNWNGKEVTPRCLDSLLASDCPADRIVVVDNASTDGSADLVRGRYPQVVLIENDSNLGFAEGNNVGIRYLLEQGFELVMLLNNDAVVDAQCLCEMKRAAEREPAAAYGATIYEMSGPERLWYAGGTISRYTLDARHHTETAELKGTLRTTELITGCCMLFRAEALKKIGLLDEDFFAYYEDVDWCLRAQGAGERLAYVPAAIVRHDVSHSFQRTGSETGAGRYSWSQSRPLVLYLAYRNRLLLARKHARGNVHRAILLVRRLARAAIHASVLLLSARSAQALAVTEGTLDGFRSRARSLRLSRYVATALARPR